MTPEEKYGRLGPGRIEGFALRNNVRDLGGYEVTGGRHIRRGAFIRTTALGLLTPGELMMLGRLAPVVCLDLRSAGEAESLPDPEVDGMAYVRIGGMWDARGREVDFSTGDIDRFKEEAAAHAAPSVKPSKLTPGSEDVASDFMHDMYASMAFDNPAFQQLFAWMAEGVAPIVLHCSAGKDRTGVAAMLIMLALGASEEDVLFEYALTNTYRARAIERIQRQNPDSALATLAEGVLPQFGQAVLETIKDLCGSYDAYFEAEYGLDADALLALRQAYTA